ncbi:MAG: hypothetical protein WBV23_06115 [Desulfobaccales bacterium]
MGDHRRGNLVIFELILAEKKLAGDIPGRGKPIDADRSTVCINFIFIEFNLAEFKAFLLLPLRRPPGTLPWRIQKFLGVNDVDSPFLEFDRITAGLFGQVN